MKKQAGSTVTSLIFAIWLLAVGTGFIYLNDYSLTDSRSGEVPNIWPRETTLTLDNSLLTLVLLLHPKCACSKATLNELERLLVHVGDKIKTTILFTTQSEGIENVKASVLWKKATRLRGVTTVVDKFGKEAKLFGSFTSGQVALFNNYGKRLFQGGITDSRGHEGANLGIKRIRALVKKETLASESTPVFGCGLFDKEVRFKINDKK